MAPKATAKQAAYKKARDLYERKLKYARDKLKLDDKRARKFAGAPPTK
tara:strand:- start:352 stop:495 length:144 start_codon:yes stop_codon:yes gene_type:complete